MRIRGNIMTVRLEHVILKTLNHSGCDLSVWDKVWAAIHYNYGSVAAARIYSEITEETYTEKEFKELFKL